MMVGLTLKILRPPMLFTYGGLPKSSNSILIPQLLFICCSMWFKQHNSIELLYHFVQIWAPLKTGRFLRYSVNGTELHTQIRSMMPLKSKYMYQTFCIFLSYKANTTTYHSYYMGYFKMTHTIILLEISLNRSILYEIYHKFRQLLLVIKSNWHNFHRSVCYPVEGKGNATAPRLNLRKLNTGVVDETSDSCQCQSLKTCEPGPLISKGRRRRMSKLSGRRTFDILPSYCSSVLTPMDQISPQSE